MQGEAGSDGATPVLHLHRGRGNNCEVIVVKQLMNLQKKNKINHATQQVDSKHFPLDSPKQKKIDCQIQKDSNNSKNHTADLGPGRMNASLSCTKESSPIAHQLRKAGPKEGISKGAEATARVTARALVNAMSSNSVGGDRIGISTKPPEKFR